jgi:hypothetical protein
MSNKSLVNMAKLGMIHIPASAWDALIPHSGNVHFQALVEYMAAGHVREIGRNITDKKHRTRLAELSHSMAKSALAGLLESWDDGDICPPFPFPFPFPFPYPWPNPHPEPEPYFEGFKFRTPAVEQLVYADMLMSLSEVTTSAEFNKALVSSAVGIAKGFGSLADDFEKCGTRPRPIPKPKKLEGIGLNHG